MLIREMREVENARSETNTNERCSGTRSLATCFVCIIIASPNNFSALFTSFPRGCKTVDRHFLNYSRCSRNCCIASHEVHGDYRNGSFPRNRRLSVLLCTQINAHLLIYHLTVSSAFFPKYNERSSNSCPAVSVTSLLQTNADQVFPNMS